MRRRRERAFVRTACFLLAALLLFLALCTQIRLRAVEREIRGLRSERSALERDIRILSVRLAGRESIGEIERRAEEELGMRRCRGDQIVEIGIEKEDPA
ncbi:MAG: hypothetical protein IJQ43_03510 [Oscillospiraceae bacterium]|nr:hypothetical protein [Oscillospiraceae bacterium]